MTKRLPMSALPAVQRGVTTPARLARASLLILGLAILAAMASLWAVSAIQDAARTIGLDAEPSVALGLRMAATLGDMDAAALEDALTDGGAATGASAAFQAGTAQLAADVVTAARNITYGEQEAEPLRLLQRYLALYQQAVVEARYIGQGDPWITARRVRWASRVNRDFAVPQAQALAAANAEALEQHYSSYRAASLVYGGTGFAGFALLVIALLGVQIWLAARMRRWINPLLAAATLVAGAGGIWFGATVLLERADLRGAKADAYDSLHVLFEAKSAASALRADMSLWLLDRSAKWEAETRMDQDVQALIGARQVMLDQPRPWLEALARAQALENQGDPAGALAAAPHLGGVLGQELENITFGPPERNAATDSIAALVQAETTIRAAQVLEAAHQHPWAVARWQDKAATGGAYAFATLQAALDRTIAVNQAAFDRLVGAALAMAGLMPWAISAILVLTVLLSTGGLWLRLREYR